ncbi:MAG: transketolase [Proteobacteria bacterium]|nr:transketolase [Pseudomonadota bacterium]MDA1058972.1 transketolase [Pseudomonadota bacterium]
MRDMANAIRALAMDAVEQANSGHPGMPMGMADVATVLFSKFLKFDPDWPDWPDRDRFVLSAGHGSMLLYSLLFLTGYPDMTLDQLRRFRQLGSRTPGHPEYGATPGIETTTGPLGQGLATAVGMALAERMLHARFGTEIVDHRTWVIAGDGCLMEGISHEAISMAGHFRLGGLIVLFDDNSISIDGPTNLSVDDDQLARFAASGWHIERADGHDPDDLARAMEAATQDPRPSLIACKTVIGFGAPKKQGTASTHGSPLGAEEIAAARVELNWPHPPFEIPADILDSWRAVAGRGRGQSRAWHQRLRSLDKRDQKLWHAALAGDTTPVGDAILAFKARLASERPTWATRKSSQEALEAINAVLATTIGGSADLTGSNNTKTKNMAVVTPDDFGGRYLHYGVREHGMAAAMNGLALHGGFIPYGGTFLVFTDYLRPALRLSALMKQRVIYVMTHDSIGLGEDGPTHQPVEQLASVRAMPNVVTLRPADAVETAECWEIAIDRTDGPCVIALSRQGLPAVRLDHVEENLCRRGAYEIAPANGDAVATLFATGSEVAVALAARDILAKAGHPSRVISVPSWELFQQQPADYRADILGRGTVRVAVEAGVRMGWDGFIGEDGIFVGMTSFGESAPVDDLYEHFGITADAIAQRVTTRLAEST